jgi:hypothetical protein
VCTGFWWGSLRERDHWGDPVVDGRIILRGIFKKGVAGHGLDLSGSGVAGCCECGNETLGSIKCGEFLWPAEYRLASQEGLLHGVSMYK